MTITKDGRTRTTSRRGVKLEESFTVNNHTNLKTISLETRGLNGPQLNGNSGHSSSEEESKRSLHNGDLSPAPPQENGIKRSPSPSEGDKFLYTHKKFKKMATIAPFNYVSTPTPSPSPVTKPPPLQLKMPPSSQPSPSTPCSPSPEFLHRHITKLISENQAIVETNDPLWPSKKYLQRSKQDKDSPSSPSRNHKISPRTNNPSPSPHHFTFKVNSSPSSPLLLSSASYEAAYIKSLMSPAPSSPLSSASSSSSTEFSWPKKPLVNNHQQQQQQQPQQMSTNYLSRHDDDLGFDPFHETQKALAEMIEKEEQRSRLTQYHQHQQAQNLLQQNILAAQQHRDSLLQQNQLLVAQQQREQNLLQQQAREQQLQQQQAAVREQQLREQLQQQKERERLVAAMFDPRGPPSLPTLRDLSTNSSLFHKGATSPADLYTSALSNATKLLDNFCLSSSSPSRSRYPPAPPPGFSTSNGFTPGGGGGNFSPKLLDSMADHLVSSAATGSKLLPAFVQHAGLIGNSQPQSANSSLSSNFQHSQLSQAPAPAWDWTALDPAIMSAGQHCDVFTTPPPPGFTPMRQTLDNF
uniref:Uncharacterized protein n=1 Tax=Cacopsylla melanoneura TaxID=428564 RepID=A0A8D9ANC8_9HEMI